ncbi:ATP-binding cassette domain-containing protein [Streptomyces sp. JNUCC 63]
MIFGFDNLDHQESRSLFPVGPIGRSPHHRGEPLISSPENTSALPQDVVLVPGIRVERNIALGKERFWTSRGKVSSQERIAVERALRHAGARFSSLERVADLSTSEQRLVQIAQQLLSPGGVLLLDEPTAVLSEPDSERLLETVSDLHDHGKAILYISHRLNEILRISDRITVLRDGKTVRTYTRGEVTRSELVEAMARRRSNPGPRPSEVHREATPGHELLRARDVQCEGASVDEFTARVGQIVGITGIQGSGCSEFAHTLSSWIPCTGSVEVDGQSLTPGSVRSARAAGVALVPAERAATIVRSATVRQNVVLSSTRKRQHFGTRARFGFRSYGAERATTARYVASLQIHPANSEARTGSPSGGNQQRVALARLLESEARVMIVEEPTQGIDVNAKQEILALLRDIANRDDSTVIVAISEFDEVLELADEIHVMRLGKRVASYLPEETDCNTIPHDALP